MMFRRISRATCLLLVASVIAAFPAEAEMRESKLGEVEFPTSGSEQAQQHFLRGLAALHSFWYEEALEAFRKSTTVDPHFTMGYWGEAMAYNHPLWREQDTEAAGMALAKIMDSNKVTPREHAYLSAVKVLYGAGEKPTRDKAYASAMENISRDYPEDLEAACFYALSLLGLARQSDDAYRLQIQAGAITLDIFRKNPDHPCAAHYTIHAFDHPDLAILALPAARRYAEIAPESHHAQHMPAHIFLQLGMWPEAAASNESGWSDSVAWVKRESLPMGLRDYHSLHWLLYVYLQQGRYKKAEEVLNLKRKDMMEPGSGRQSREAGFHRKVGRYYERMASALIVETQRWELAATLAEPPGSTSHDAPKAPLSFIRALGAAMKGRPEAEGQLGALRSLREQRFERDPFFRPERLEIWELEVAAVSQASKGNYQEAIALMKQATALEEELPSPSGPPRVIKPTHELLGEIFLRAGRPKEAARQFAISLKRHPNRARSLLGAARAAAQSGDRRGAVDVYSQLLEVWAQADAEMPELHEVREYVDQAGEKVG